MPVLEGYENADTPHAKTVMAPGWTYGCHSSKTGDKPRGGPSTYRVQVGQRFTLDCGSMEATAVQKQAGDQLNEARFSSIHRGLSTVAQKVQLQALLKEMS